MLNLGISQLGYRKKRDEFDVPEDGVAKNHMVIWLIFADIVVFPLVCNLGIWGQSLRPRIQQQLAIFPWDKAARLAIRLSRRSQGTAQGCNVKRLTHLKIIPHIGAIP